MPKPKSSLILHLTDLHLGTVGEQELGDYKAELVEPEHRQNREDMLRTTMKCLPEALPRKQRLDAIVMTGDFTTANEESGFELFDKLVKDIPADLRPTEDRIVVMPGNHDVMRGTAPGTKARYERFLAHIGSKGYVCAWLDGCGDAASARLLVDEEAGWAIAPINSANWCQQIETLKDLPESMWEELCEKAESKSEKARRELERMRLHDVARVSHPQLNALRAELNRLDGSILRIAALHHHLLPVSPDEELKTYESITNLGLLRTFLRDNRIRLVMHGHKHRSAWYWDEIPPLPDDEPVRPHRVLVVSGSTVGPGESGAREACRLLEIQGRGTTRSVALTRIAGALPGAELRKQDLDRHPLWPMPPQVDVSMPPPTVVSGKDSAEVYVRLMEVVAERRGVTDPLYNLVSQVAEGQSALTLPPAYPKIPDCDGDEARQRWFEEQVRWWQHPRRVRDPADFRYAKVRFTHGDRIYAPAPNGSELTRLDRAVEALLSEGLKSGRAMISLIDSEHDRVDDDDRGFPAFGLVQFVLRAGQPNCLDVIGYFRKQELKYWWPVNMAELAKIQDTVAGRISGEDLGRVQPGAVTAVCALAYAGVTEPQVRVPWIDRVYDEDPDEIWDLAFGLVGPRKPDPETWRANWDRLLTDLVPDEEYNLDGVPIALEGLASLARRVTRLTRYHDSGVQQIADALTDLAEANRDYAETRAPTHQKHTAWRKKTLDKTDAIRRALDKLPAADE